MNIVIWIVTILVAVAYIGAGYMKATTSKSKLMESPKMSWAEGYPAPIIRLIGIAEILGAVGLILPGIFGIAPWLVPTAATGLALIMFGAVATHLRRGERQSAVVSVVLFALTVFVAITRFGAWAL